MTPLDHVTSAFECLWETKVHLLRACEGADAETTAKLYAAVKEVAGARDHLETLLIEVQAKQQAAAVPLQG